MHLIYKHQTADREILCRTYFCAANIVGVEIANV